MLETPIKFEDDDTRGLLCPKCGQQFLHHEHVHIYSRLEEDSPRGLHVTVSDEAQLRVGTELRNNPSRRRDGLRIEFWCETCSAKPKLVLLQHKGSTQIYWEAL